jgi:hypothetical protein
MVFFSCRFDDENCGCYNETSGEVDAGSAGEQPAEE